ncbi:MAG: hypothetical protein EZS28_025843, partial [Streblomastix strix]
LIDKLNTTTKTFKRSLSQSQTGSSFPPSDSICSMQVLKRVGYGGKDESYFLPL